MCELVIVILQSALAPPPVVQAPPTAESAVEPELVGDHDGAGLAVGIVSRYIHTVHVHLNTGLMEIDILYMYMCKKMKNSHTCTCNFGLVHGQ